MSRPRCRPPRDFCFLLPRACVWYTLGEICKCHSRCANVNTQHRRRGRRRGEREKKYVTELANLVLSARGRVPLGIPTICLLTRRFSLSLVSVSLYIRRLLLESWERGGIKGTRAMRYRVETATPKLFLRACMSDARRGAAVCVTVGVSATTT